MCALLGVQVTRVTIVEDEDAAGRCQHEPLLGQYPEFADSDSAEKEVLISLAGQIAQRKYKPSSVRRYHASSDYEHAENVALSQNGLSETTNAYLERLARRAQDMLSENWNFVVAVAGELVAKKEIQGCELESLRE